MNEKTTRVLLLSLIAGFIVCSVLLVQQSARLKSLQDQIAEQEVQLDRIGTELDIAQARQASNIKLRSLSSGVYALSTEVAVDPFEAERDLYTIYNFVLDIGVGAVRRKLQFGYAHSGVLTHVIYFDHDSDGSIDTKMMNDYAESIPGLSLAASWLIEPEHSQAVYDAFRLNVDSADQLAIGDVTASAGAEIGAMWAWLNEQSDGFSNWIEEAIEFN